MRILVIEDEPGVAAFIQKGLREAGYSVDLAGRGDEGYRLARNSTYDAIVLDLMLPGKSGFEILGDLRAHNVETPIICLTARDAVNDRVQGLNLGADDYLSKPFSFSELLARIGALLRRGHHPANQPIVVGDLSIDVLTRTVRRGQRRIDLSPREYALLEYLARNHGHILTRAMLLEHVWDMKLDPLTNVVDVHINRLRKKLALDSGEPKSHRHGEPSGAEPQLIQTIRGVGYVLGPPAAADRQAAASEAELAAPL
jgi:DNA-binding response OmpR family regulator